MERSARTVRATKALRQEPEGHWAIGLTFYVPKRDRASFRATAGRALMPRLVELRDAGRIIAVLPFRHKPLKTRGETEGTSWTDYWVIAVAADVDPDDVWNAISVPAEITGEAPSLGLLRAEILRPQPGIQMYYPRTGGVQQGARLWQFIEYVISKPEARQAYYEDNYRFSAPAMRRMYEADAVGRFIGFEVTRVLESRGAPPSWDMIHIVGVAGVMSFLKIAWIWWRQRAVFNSFARNAGHSSFIDVVRSWKAQREKYMINCVQDPNYTLHSR